MAKRKDLPAIKLWNNEQPLNTNLNAVQASAARFAHPGLVLTRYLPLHDKESNGKRSTLVAAQRAQQNAHQLYAEAFKERSRWLERVGAKTFPLTTASRLIIGLGTESPLETGLRLHHSYGVPMIPGPALKGLAAHYCDRVWGQVDPELGQKMAYDEDGTPKTRPGQRFEVLFGNAEDAGHVVFHDAWIDAACLLQPNQGLLLDVMTPHHGDYYAGKVRRHPDEREERIGPTDFDDPTPIAFLSVTGIFHFALSCDDPTAHGQAWLNRAKVLLCEALAYWGVGGKTSSGYGRFVVDERTAPVQRASATAVSPTGTPDPPKASKRQVGSKVKVKVLEAHAKIKGSFFVQEPDQPKRGLLTGDKAPPADKLPEIGAEIEVYINSLGPPPQYRWNPPPPPADPRDRRAKGPRR